MAEKAELLWPRLPRKLGRGQACQALPGRIFPVSLAKNHFFDLYSGSKEIDFLEKFGIGPVILKKVLCIVSLHLTTSKVTRVVSHCKLTQTINR